MSIKIYIWPNDDWCFEDEYRYLMSAPHAVLCGSDDFRVIELADDFNLVNIDDFVYKLNRNLM